MTNNKTILAWIDEMKALVNPDQVVWIDGSEEQLEELRKEAVESGEMIKLNQEKLPGCYYHRTAPNDVARVEDRTLICSRKEEDAGPTNHWKEPQEAYKMLYDIARGSYKGRTMYVIPYSMGPVGSPLAKIGVELTDSIYVVLNMSIMTRVGQKVMDVLGDSNDWVRGLHCKCDVDPEKRWICQFPEDNTIISVNSAYGGNVLLGKKCFALRIASYQAKNEGWMAEHMLILGVENPKGEVKYVCAAFPSACGKTNLAMMIPPEGYRAKGYKVWTVGDDIAWMRKGPDGRLYAINPENGFFGVAPGTNMKSNPNALISTQKGAIFTNVARNLDDNTVWWESLDKNPPVNAEEWKGAKVNGPEYIAAGNKLAHPNSRFTAPTANCPCLSSEFENPQGVPVSAIVFGGRVRIRFRWFTSPEAGTTVSSSVPSPAPRPPQLLQVQSALSVVTRWLCSRSAATTWATTSSTGSKWARCSATRLRRSSTSTGSVSTKTATSFGRASVTTSVFSSGSSSAAITKLTLLRRQSATFRSRKTSTSKVLRTSMRRSSLPSSRLITLSGLRKLPA